MVVSQGESEPDAAGGKGAGLPVALIRASWTGARAGAGRPAVIACWLEGPGASEAVTDEYVDMIAAGFICEIESARSMGAVPLIGGARIAAWSVKPTAVVEARLGRKIA